MSKDVERTLRVTFVTNAEKAEAEIRALAQASRDQARSQKEVEKANIAAAKSADTVAKATKSVGDESKKTTTSISNVVNINQDVRISYEKVEKVAKSSYKAAAVGAAAVAAALVGTAAAVYKLGDNFAKTGDELAKNARAANMGVVEYQRLARSMSLAGVEMRELDTGLQRMSLGLAGAGRGAQEVNRGLTRIGIEAAELRGLSPEEQFLRIADAMERTSDGTERAAATAEIFGRNNRNMTAALAQGSDALRAQGDEAQRLGLIMSEDAAKQAEDLNDALNTMKATAGAVTRDLGGAFAPALQDVADGVSNWIGENRDLIDQGLQGLVDGITGAMDTLAPQIAAVADEVLQWLSENEDLIEQDLPKFIIGVTNGVVGAVTAIAQLVSWIHKTSQAIERMSDNPLIKSAIDGTLAGVGGGVIDGFSAVGELLGMLGSDAEIEEQVAAKKVARAQKKAARELEHENRAVEREIARHNATLAPMGPELPPGFGETKRSGGRSRSRPDAPHAAIQGMLGQTAANDAGDGGMVAMWESERQAAEQGMQKLRDQVLEAENKRADDVMRVRMRSLEMAEANGLTSDEALRREADAYAESARIRQTALNAALEEERAHAEILREQKLAELEIDRELGLDPETAMEREREIVEEHQAYLLDRFSQYAAERGAIAEQSHRAELSRINAVQDAERKAMDARVQRYQRMQTMSHQLNGMYNNLSATVVQSMAVQGASEERMAKVSNIARGVQSAGIGVLEMVKAVSAFASFNYAQGALHLTASALGFANAATLRSGDPGGGASGGSSPSFSMPPMAAQSEAPRSEGAAGVPISRGSSSAPESIPAPGGGDGGSRGGRTVNVNIQNVSTLATSDDELGLKLRRVISDSESMVGAA